MAGENVLAEAFVRLRALADGSFEKDARDQLLPAAGRIATDLASTFAAKKLFDIGKSGFDELKDAQAVTSQTTVLLKNLGSTAGVTSEDVDNLAQSMLQQSGVDDEVAKAAENTLLRLGLQGQAFKDATQDSNDLSVAMGTDMTSAAELLGKALAHPEQAARLLKPAIGGLTDEQLNSIKAFQAQGNAAGAQGVILDAVKDKVGGAAKAYGDTLPGELSKATESWKNAKAELVGGFAPAMELGASLTSDFAAVIQGLPGPVSDALGAVVLLGGGIASMARPVSDVIGLVTRWKDAHQAATTATEAQTVANEGLVASEDAVAASGEAAGVGIAAMLGPIGIAAVAIGGLVAALTLFSTNEEAASVKAADYTQALKEQQGVLDDNIDAVTAHALAQENSARTVHDAGVSYKVMFDAVRAGTDDFGEMKRQVADAGNTLEEGLKKGGAQSTAFGQSLLTLAENGKLTREQAEDLLKVMEGLHNKFVDQKTAVDAEKEALQGNTAAKSDATGATSDLTGATGDLTGATDTSTEATRKAVDATKDLTDAQHASIDPFFAVMKATEDNVKAQSDYNDAVHKYGAGSKEAVDANLKVVQSAQDVNDAVQQLAAGMEDGTTSTAKAKDQLNIWVAQGLITQKQADQVSYSLGIVNGSMDNLNGKRSDMTVSANTAQAEYAVAVLQNHIRDLQTLANKGVIVNVTPGGSVVSHATGGPVRSGEVFEGAELGAELLLLNGHGLYQAPGDGTVLTAEQTRSFFAGSGGGSQSAGTPATIVVPVVIDGREFARVTAPYNSTAIRDYDRSLR